MLYGITFIDGGFRPAIAKQGPKWTHVVMIDGTRVVTRRVKNNAVGRFRTLSEYSLAKMAKRFLRKKNCLGLKMTVAKSARRILEEALS